MAKAAQYLVDFQLKDQMGAYPLEFLCGVLWTECQMDLKADWLFFVSSQKLSYNFCHGLVVRYCTGNCLGSEQVE